MKALSGSGVKMLSLTQHQAKNTEDWQFLMSLLDQKLISQAEASMVKIKHRLNEYPPEYDFAFSANVLINSYRVQAYPDHLHTIIGYEDYWKRVQHKSLSVVTKGYILSVCQEAVRLNQQANSTQRVLMEGDLTAKDTTLVKAYLDDVLPGLDYLTTHVPKGVFARFNIHPCLAWFSADYQAEIDGKTMLQIRWSLASKPMSGIVARTLAYWLLEDCKHEECIIALPRQEQTLTIDPKDFLNGSISVARSDVRTMSRLKMSAILESRKTKTLGELSDEYQQRLRGF